MPTFGAPRPLVRSAWAADTASAKSGGVRSPGGVLTQSRHSRTASTTTWAASKASVASARRAMGLSTTTSTAPAGAVSVSAPVFAAFTVRRALPALPLL